MGKRYRMVDATWRQRVVHQLRRGEVRYTDSTFVDWLERHLPHGQADLAYAPSGVMDWAIELVCKALRAHIVEDDQCGRPEHRYCTNCRTLRPNEPVAKTRWVAG